MSWQPKLTNVNAEALALAREKQKKEAEASTSELLKAENSTEVVGHQFVCAGCGTGWTFSRLRTIQCCGINYVRG